MMKRLWPICALALAAPGFAADLREATFTQVIKDVTVVSAGTKSTAKAKLNEKFINPDIVQTGPDSLAELIAADKTVTRIGANTIFSFSGKGRELNLEQGSVLFHSPKGKGGGTVKTKAASASVLGTTIVVTATVGGGFKAIVLEGRGQITLPNGSFRILTAGQVTFVLPGSRTFGPQLNINLGKLVESSRLVQGFAQELPSQPVIQDAVDRQNVLIRTGVAEDTKILVGNQATENTVATVDSTVLEQAVENRVDRLAVAKATDVIITTSDLRDHPDNVFLDPVPFDISALGALNFSGFVGKNVTIAPNVTQLDFAPFLNQADFTVGAAEYLNIQTATLQLFATLPGMGTPALQNVTLAGKLGLTIVPGACITAFHIGELHFITDGAMSLNNVTFANSGGKVRLNAKSVLDLTGGGISSTPSMTLEGGAVSLTGGSYNVGGTAVVSAYGTELNTSGATIGGDIVSLEANTSSDLHTTTVAANTLLNLNSQQDVKVGGGSYTVSGSGGTLQVSAGRDIIASSSASFMANSIQMTATAGSATLTGISAIGDAALTANAGQNLTDNGSSLGASLMSGSAQLTAGQSLSLTGTTLMGNTIQASGKIIDLNTTTASASSFLTASAAQDLNVNAGSLSVSGASGTAQLTAGHNLTVVNGAQFQANSTQLSAANNAVLNNVQARGFTMLNVSAAGNLAVASGSFTGASISPTIAASLSAGDTLTVNGTSIGSVANISLSARTVDLSNINFPGGSTVNLNSQLGLLAANPNTGAASVPGHVNFILNVNYNGNPAQLYVGNGINIGVRH